ncbi:Lipopolysaccharide heptosyltransferase I [Flavobacterium longum]
MGDVAMTVPVLRQLVAQYPELKITVVSKGFFKPFFDDIPNVSFLAADTPERGTGLSGIIRLFRDLRKLKVDALADLHNVLRSKILRLLFAMVGKNTASTDKARAEKRALIRPENKVFKPLKPVTERHAEVFAALGFPIDLSHPIFPANKQMDEVVRSLAGAKSGQWIGIAPFAQHQGKVYPADLMQQVIDQLAENASDRIFLFGAGNAETDILNRFAKGRENVIVVAGKIKFTQELQLISNLDLMLSMDSGNAHIAAMYGVKTVTLWGATHPFTGFAPFAQPLGNALTADREQFPKLPTSVYGNVKVAGYEDAMRTIAPDTIIAKIHTLLASR